MMNDSQTSCVRAHGTVWVLQHLAPETPGVLGEVLAAAGWSVRVCRVDRGERLPPVDDALAGLVVMGGPMGVYETAQYPWLRDELAFVRRAVDAGRPVLGVCLGSQLLAAALGAEVKPGPRQEIGWFPITLTDAAADDPLLRGLPPTLTVAHWHGDVFTLPPGATLLAGSALTAHQVFRYGACAYGFLCHLEFTPAMVATMAETFADELRAAGVDGAALVRAAPTRLAALDPHRRLVFSRWLALLEPRG